MQGLDLPGKVLVGPGQVIAAGVNFTLNPPERLEERTKRLAAAIRSFCGAGAIHNRRGAIRHLSFRIRPTN